MYIGLNIKYKYNYDIAQMKLYNRAYEQFTHILEQFTCTCLELLVACALLLTRNSCKIISGF